VKSSNRSVKVEPILSLPDVVWIDGKENKPEIKDFVLRSGTMWALGRQVLLRSQDGANWQNIAANLGREGGFYVSSIVQGATDLRIFARSGKGLRCYRWDEWESAWKVIFSISTSSPGLFSAWTECGLVMAARHNPETEIICRESDYEDRPKWRNVLHGSAVHLQISFSGTGLCALWETDRVHSTRDSGSSAIYSTNDGGKNWHLVATIETMLLGGSPVDENTALVGGTGGTIGLINNLGLQELWKENGGDIVAVDANGSQQLAAIESDDESPVQGLLLREGNSKWTRHLANFDDRIQCVKLLAPTECVVCTRQTIYRCRFE
jgi:hypothetical protein